MSTLQIVIVAFVIGALVGWFADRIGARRRRDGWRPQRPLSSKVLGAAIGGIMLGVLAAIGGSLWQRGHAQPQPPAAAAADAPAPVVASKWVAAQTVAKGRTNVRQAPDVKAPVVTMLLPSQDVEVEPGAEWSAVRLPGKSTPLGFVRNDRLRR